MTCFRRRPRFPRPASLALGLLTLAPSTAIGQSDALHESWRWTHFTTAAGLPTNLVYDIVEAGDGTMWAVTSGGLAYFDDFQWRSAPNAPPSGRGPAAPGNDGELLYVTSGSLYRGGRDGFRRLDLRIDGTPLDVSSAAADPDGTVLFTAGRRLFRIGAGGIEPQAIPDEPAGGARASPTVRRTRDGTMWLETSLGLFERTPDGWLNRTAWPARVLRSRAGRRIMTTFGTLQEEVLWEWNGEGTAQMLSLGRNATALDLDARGRAIATFADGSVWVGDREGWRAITPTPEQLSIPNAILFSRDGDLWAASGTGVYVHRSSSPRWSRPSMVRAGANVDAILLARNGDLWIGTLAGIVIEHADGTTERIDRIAGTAIRSITALGEDADGGIWIGSGSGSGFQGAYRWYRGRWRHFGTADGLAASHIHRIARDRAGRLWFLGIAAVVSGTATDPEPGAFVLEDTTFRRWPEPGALSSDRVYAFAEAPDGSRWFGTLGGLSRWRDGVWQHWTRASGLRRNRVFTLTVTQDGTVWFGHKISDGLGYLEPGGDPQYLTSLDGLADDRVWEVTAAGDGAVWVGTQRGLSRVSGGTFTTFRAAHGLRHEQTWPVVVDGSRVLVGTKGGGLYALQTDESADPLPRVVLQTPVIDRRSAHFHWAAFAYRGAVRSDLIETRFRLDDGVWSAWGPLRESEALEVSPGNHRFTVQAKGLFGDVDHAGASVGFHIAPPVYRHPLVLALFTLWALGLAWLGTHYLRSQRRFLAELEQMNLAVEAKNAELEVRNVELEERNAEMERFAYTVSHDLKSPLVTIRGFVGMLERDAIAGRPDRMQRDVDHISEATDRMDQLLDELLHLSRAGQSVGPPEAVPLTEATEEALRFLDAAVVDAGALVHVAQDMPAVHANRVRLVEVLQNLLENALKFMGAQLDPQVWIEAAASGSTVTCSVRDNGVGIAQRHLERIFGLFEQLDPDRGGTGIGLALVKRIVEAQGGSVHVASDGPGRGTVFSFSLPAAHRPAPVDAGTTGVHPERG